MACTVSRRILIYIRGNGNITTLLYVNFTAGEHEGHSVKNKPVNQHSMVTLLPIVLLLYLSMFAEMYEQWESTESEQGKVSEMILNGTSAQSGCTVPFMSVYDKNAGQKTN